MHVYRFLIALSGAAALGAAPAVHAHELLTHHAGFAAGFAHPFLGLDHVLAMLAVGLIAAQQGAQSAWRIPASFLVLMAIGAAAGATGWSLPMFEAAVAGSALCLGLLIALAVRFPGNVILGLVGVFALFHGHAHGVEMPAATQAVIYAPGFLAATALLHLLGFAAGIGAQRFLSAVVLRMGGAAIAMGSFLLWA